MSMRARRLGGAFSLLALLALVAVGLATAASPPPPAGAPPKPGKVPPRRAERPHPNPATSGGVHACNRLPAVRQADTLEQLVDRLRPLGRRAGAHRRHRQGGRDAVRPGLLGDGAEAGRTRQSGLASARERRPAQNQVQRQRSATVRRPGLPGQHWILGWRISYTGLSSAVNGADLRLNAPGAAGVLAATLCGAVHRGQVRPHHARPRRPGGRPAEGQRLRGRAHGEQPGRRDQRADRQGHREGQDDHGLAQLFASPRTRAGPRARPFSFRMSVCFAAR